MNYKAKDTLSVEGIVAPRSAQGMNPSFEVMLTAPETAAYLRVSGSFLAKARMTGSGPRYRKFRRSVRYAVQDLVEFQRGRTRTSTSQY